MLRRLVLVFLLASFHSFGMCQTQSGCGELPESTSKLFVFIGELLHLEALPLEEGQKPDYMATYKIVDRVCGTYLGDTIRFTHGGYDAEFKKSRYKLFMLTKDLYGTDGYELQRGLTFDVFRTAQKQWVGVYKSGFDAVFMGQEGLKPKRRKFARDAFFDTKGMSMEEADRTYPAPYYDIKKDRAMPVLGCGIEELFQHEKEGTLAYMGIYESPKDPSRKLMIKEVEMTYIEEDADSVKQVLEAKYIAIRDSIKRDPFNLANASLLFENCRLREDQGCYLAYFDDLVRCYPDSIKTYLIKAKYAHPWPSLEDSSKIQTLLQALRIDSNNYEANYEMADSYYRLFRAQPSSYFAKAARKWFLKCVDIDKSQLVLLKIPILRLSNYLNDVAAINLYRQHPAIKTNVNGVPEGNSHNWYFPAESFLQDSIKWMTDYKVDMTEDYDYIIRRNDWFSEVFIFMQEPVLTRFSGQVYRFFHIAEKGPLIIRLEKNKQGVFVYWKELVFNDSIGWYETPVEQKRKVSSKKWKNFEKILASFDYWSLGSVDSNSYGDLLLLEASINGRYKMVERNGYYFRKYRESIKFLIGLTDLDIPVPEQ